jgi:hypothetical protein
MNVLFISTPISERNALYILKLLLLCSTIPLSLSLCFTWFGRHSFLTRKGIWNGYRQRRPHRAADGKSCGKHQPHHIWCPTRDTSQASNQLSPEITEDVPPMAWRNPRLLLRDGPC